jgi:hypothetical protein
MLAAAANPNTEANFLLGIYASPLRWLERNRLDLHALFRITFSEASPPSVE